MMRYLIVLLLIACGCASTPEPESHRTVSVTLDESPDRLARLLLQLMSDAPPARSLTVELSLEEIPDEEEILGQAIQYEIEGGGEFWVIRIDSRLDYQLQRMVLTHEWAHVLQGDGGCGLEGSHGPSFGVAWAAAWRAAVGEEN
jgi:hypothetical protein